MIDAMTTDLRNRILANPSLVSMPTGPFVEGVVARTYDNPRQAPSYLDLDEMMDWYRGYDA